MVLGNWIPIFCVDRVQATGGVNVDMYWLWRGRKWLLVRRTEPSPPGWVDHPGRDE